MARGGSTGLGPDGAAPRGTAQPGAAPGAEVAVRSGKPPRLGICAIFKDEAPHLLEWLAFHVAVGVERFVLYDNASTDGGADLLRQSRFAERVTVEHWPNHPGQLAAYRHFLAHHAQRFDWAAFIDLDEFLLPLDDAAVPALLARMDGFSAVLVQWRVFGPSGRDTRPDGLTIEAYHLRAPDDLPVNCHVKTILRCADALDVTHNPHAFRLRGPVCDPSGRIVENSALPSVACHEGLVLNHYQTRSRAEWLAKVWRGNAMFVDAVPAYPPALIEHYEAVCRTEDRTIMAWAPRVKALLADGPPPLAVPFVFRDQSRPGAPWQAALRDTADPFGTVAMLRDAAGQARDFASEAAALAACQAAPRGWSPFP